MQDRSFYDMINSTFLTWGPSSIPMLFIHSESYDEIHYTGESYINREEGQMINDLISKLLDKGLRAN